MPTPSHQGRVLAVGGALGAIAIAGGVVVTAPATAAAPSHVVISEAYGGGGNSGATLKNDFVELYNPTASAISLAGWTVKYYSAAGNLGNTCTLPTGASIAPGGHFLIQQSAGAGGTEALPTPDATCTASMSGTSGSVELSDGTTTVDLVGYGSGATKRETTPAPGTTNATSVQRKADGPGYVDTDNNSLDFTAGAPTPKNSGSTNDGGTTPTPTPTPTITPIAAIQGSGATSPLAGRTVTTTGVVTAVYPTGGFNGFYLQTPGSGGANDATPGASDGIFVYGKTDVEVGACYTLTAGVTEYHGLTELEKVSAIAPATGTCAPVAPVELDETPKGDAAKEALEGMLVLPKGVHTITNNYALNTFGQLGLTQGTEPLYQATDVVRPGAEAAAYEAANKAREITLDDGSSWNHMTNRTAQGSPLPYLSQGEPMRTNSQVTFTKPVILDYRFQWNYQPTGQIVGATDEQDPLATENDRETTVPAVGGDVKLAAFNVLNYFTDLGKDEENCRYYADRLGNPVATNYCQVRGAWTKAAFEDQQAKIVTAINKMDADVVSLMEIEANSSVTYLNKDRDEALRMLVGELNARGGNYAYVPSPVATPANEDVIRTAFIYDKSRIQTLGASQIMQDEAFANARYPLAQKFKLKQAGSPFVVVANHFKSKGSGEDDGTGQGLSNPSRIAQAEALAGWVEEMYPDEAVMLMGDFNAYSKEDPIRILEEAGYTEEVKRFEPTSTTYQFGGRLGSLDHALGNEKASARVTGAAVWDINADESIAMQYSRRNYNVTDFHTDSEFASSDHDPVLVGMNVAGGKNVGKKPGKGKGKVKQVASS